MSTEKTMELRARESLHGNASSPEEPMRAQIHKEEGEAGEATPSGLELSSFGAAPEIQLPSDHAGTVATSHLGHLSGIPQDNKGVSGPLAASPFHFVWQKNKEVCGKGL